MRPRLPVALGGVVLTAAAMARWRRAIAAAPPVRRRSGDGSTAAHDGSDPSAPEPPRLAAGLRHHLEIGG
jgi:hypothetical protein